MIWKPLLLSIALALVWTGAALYAARPVTPQAPKTFVVRLPDGNYGIEADEARIEGFCTVFLQAGARIAAVCGQHTWSESAEVQ